MLEPAAVALHAVRQGRVDAGDAVLIFGAGPIGLLAGSWARIRGAGQVLLADVEPTKLDFAEGLGFDLRLNPRDLDVGPWVRAITDRGADVVVEASGSAAAFEDGMRAARTFGRVVLMGNPAGDMRLSQHGYWAILRKELTVRGTWNSRYGAPPKDEWALAMDSMASGRLDVGPLITHRVALDGLVDALVMMRDRGEFFNKVMYVA